MYTKHRTIPLVAPSALKARAPLGRVHTTRVSTRAGMLCGNTMQSVHSVMCSDSIIGLKMCHGSILCTTASAPRT